MNDIVRAKELVREIEDTLTKIKYPVINIPELHVLQKDLVKQWFAVKLIVALVVAILLGASFGGIITWYHFKQDHTRYEFIHKQIDILTTRTDFMISYQKDIQQQMIRLHGGEYGPCKD